MRPIDRVLERLEGVKQHNGYFMAFCPAHDDRREPSLSIREGDDERALLNCFAGCSFEEIVAALGLEPKDLFPNGGRGGEGGSIPSDNTRYVDTGCSLEDYASAKGLPIGFLGREARLRDMHYIDKPAVWMPYLDESGEEVCVRFRVSLGESPKVKTRKGDKHTLYGLWRLPEVRNLVVLVEGESDAHTLWHHDIPALGIPGASSWLSEWSDKLEGVEFIYVVIEPDAAGEGLWEKLAASSIRERLYRIDLDGFKDVSELHLGNPERFGERFGQALGNATSYMDIAGTEAQERRREAWAACGDLAQEPHILDRFVEDLGRCGVAGEENTAKLLYLALNTRHLTETQLVNVAVKGPSSSGKSFLVEKVLGFYPDAAYHMLTAMSERALAYSDESLSHRFLVLAEAAGMSGEFQTYLIRSLLSEGKLRYETVERTNDGIKPRIIERNGPTGLIVTTTRLRLHNENETRMLTVTADDSPDHTRAIFAALADEDYEPPDLSQWVALQEWVGADPVPVTIPYSKVLAQKIPAAAVRLRRDFKALLNLIRSHALLHRESRATDATGRIIANLEDYEEVRELVAGLVAEGVGATVPQIVRDTVWAVRVALEKSEGSTTTIKKVGEQLQLDYSATYRRVKLALDGGFLKRIWRSASAAQLD
jgi:hypothetical protein